MVRDPFEEELADLRAGVLGLGETVVDRLEQAVDALAETDREAARYVLEHDHEINERYLALESDCIDIFTLQQPVATDLRVVAASFKILTDLERIGDLAMNLGGYVIEMNQSVVPRADLVNLGRIVVGQVRRALAAYENDDAARCHEVAERDQEVDGLCERVADILVRNLVERDPGGTEYRTEGLLNEAFQVLLTLREFERIGDHAVNVAARTLYMVENDETLLY